MVKEIILFGSTGSIGTRTLDICSLHDIKVNVLVANSNYKLLAKQIKKYKPEYAVIVNDNLKNDLISLVKTEKTVVLSGEKAVLEVIEKSKGLVLNAIVGMAGLLPTITAIESGKNIAIANKETLVCAGDLIMKKAFEKNIKIFPVDSEHSAIFQSLQGYENKDIKKIFLTASGGPFFSKTIKQLEKVNLADALNHPNWVMGKKITIDSATLMNKGLEVIEAVHLFDINPDKIEVVVHRESILHSAIEYADGSVIGQMGTPDMAIAIQYAITYPKRLKSLAKSFSFFDYPNLSFYKPDVETFSALKTCFDAIKDGGLSPCIVNSANEQAVELFLAEKISFLEISRIVEEARISLLKFKDMKDYELKDVLHADEVARRYVNENVKWRLNEDN